MKKTIDDEMGKQLAEELSKRETDIIEALKSTGAMDWIKSQIENEEDEKLVDAQVQEMAKKCNPPLILFTTV